MECRHYVVGERKRFAPVLYCLRARVGADVRLARFSNGGSFLSRNGRKGAFYSRFSNGGSFLSRKKRTQSCLLFFDLFFSF